jgi:hypothetical protein
VRRLATAAVLATLGLLPATAQASSYTDVLRVYQSTGSIPACKFSSPELAAALKGIDTYGQQYFADFTEAVQAALAQRASGACAHGAAVRMSATAGPSRIPLPASVTSATDANIPAPIIAMAALAAVLAASFGVGAVARGFGWDPRWAAAWRHAWGEASYRVGGGFDAFADWWRRR